MNTSQLSSYAPEARKAFIAAVSAQAARLGITSNGTADAKVQGDVLLVGGQAFPAGIASARKALAERVEVHGFDATMESIAYTWFNRFVAMRCMELHGYFDQGYRVLSHPENQGRPEILDHAADVELPSLDRARAIELKLDGTKDEELYRLLLLAQCNALHRAMPFLFEKIGDETELLLPANLLHTDSLIRQLVEQVDEDLWQEIEIIGWLYQFYISEKKDQVIGNVVKSEDIPAATQLFTPNWIVKYMVQNSLGAQWLATYPNSPLEVQMEYYIEPAEQTDEVKAQLAAITPSQLNPEELTLIDPASGSGHILVEAYDLFKAIYLERGYRHQDVVQLILEKNLFGLDIDGRAGQLTGFALMMKGRADDRGLFERGVKLNVMALIDSTGFDVERLAQGVKLVDYGLQLGDLTELKRLFEHATTFGSLIQMPEGLVAKLPVLKRLSETTSQDLFVVDELKILAQLVRQAELLTAQYDAVVANPPYMGSKGMNALVKNFTKDHFPDAKSDLFACFIERGYTLAKDAGHNAMVTMQSWMFLSSFEKMRERMLREKTIITMTHMANGVMGIAFGTAATVLCNFQVSGYATNYSYTSVDDLSDQRVPSEFPVRNDRLRKVAQDEFKKIPGSPVAYWVSKNLRDIFLQYPSLTSVVQIKHGMTTGNTDRFVRRWSEISTTAMCTDAVSQDTAAASKRKWFPIAKGGDFRKWFGNGEYLVNYENRAAEMEEAFTAGDLPGFRHDNSHLFFRPLLVGSGITSAAISFRYVPAGSVVDVNLRAIYAASSNDEDDCKTVLGFLGSSLVSGLTRILNPTLATNIGDIARLPFNVEKQSNQLIPQLFARARDDWDAYEISWDFDRPPTLTESAESTSSLESNYTNWVTQNREAIADMKCLEEENNRRFIDAYGLADELTPDVPIEQITLTVNPAYRYGGKLTEEEQWARFRQDTMEELVSYAIGCMMGRYSLDAPGLIYAHSGNEGFDPSRYTTFPADDDGIVPITDTEWFDVDAFHRLIEFISVAWDKSHLEDNLTFLADNLSPKKNESSRETLRRYLCDSFCKDHLQTYKKRPIYWLFSSGKQKAFQCLVYLHRYNEGTLSRMRSEYVIPLQGRMAARLEKLHGDIQVATSTAHQKRLQKERAKLEKQQVELLVFDEKLRHYADRRITLDLDDGVKVNYGKFGDLLAEVKTLHGKKPEVA